MPPPPPTSTLFPYTTLFRSEQIGNPRAAHAQRHHRCKGNDAEVEMWQRRGRDRNRKQRGGKGLAETLLVHTDAAKLRALVKRGQCVRERGNKDGEHTEEAAAQAVRCDVRQELAEPRRA